MEKLKYDKWKVEIVHVDDVFITSGPPDFDWGEWSNNIYEE